MVQLIVKSIREVLWSGDPSCSVESAGTRKPCVFFSTNCTAGGYATDSWNPKLLPKCLLFISQNGGSSRTLISKSEFDLHANTSEWTFWPERFRNRFSGKAGRAPIQRKWVFSNAVRPRPLDRFEPSVKGCTIVSVYEIFSQNQERVSKKPFL